MSPPRRSLRTELLVNLGFVTSAAVLLVGLTTVVLLGGDVREALWPLVGFWVGSTVVFVLFGAYVVHRLVIRPLGVLAAEADTLAGGELPPRRRRTRPRSSPSWRRGIAGWPKSCSTSTVTSSAWKSWPGSAALPPAWPTISESARRARDLRRGPPAAGQRSDITAEMHVAIGGSIASCRDSSITPGLSAAGPARPGTGPRPTSTARSTAVEFLERQGLLKGRNLALDLESGLPCAGRPARARAGGHQFAYECLPGVDRRACGRHRAAALSSPAPGRRAPGRPASGEQPGRRWVPRPRRPDLAPGTPGAMLYVADDGPGVPEADRERIFDPFFTTKPPGEGTGLGLAIVARTVYDAGGVVWVDRAREGGAVFKVFLPLAGESDARTDR